LARARASLILAKYYLPFIAALYFMHRLVMKITLVVLFCLVITCANFTFYSLDIALDKNWEEHKVMDETFLSKASCAEKALAIKPVDFVCSPWTIWEKSYNNHL
jgi:hypothetical protein